jgi:DNA-binding GntR family transcriptional regulator
MRSTPSLAASRHRARGNMADRIYDALRGEFVDGQWEFGQPFSTYELAARFEVSRRPVLDALQRLEAEGFVEIIPQVGCRVVSVDDDGVREHLELCAILYGPAAQRAAVRAGEDDVALLAAIHEQTTAAARQRAFEEFQLFHRRFLAEILRIAGNRTLAELAGQASDFWAFYFHPYRRHVRLELLEERAAEHSATLDAIRRHDGREAQRAMEYHLDPDRVLALVERFHG